jgi:hypothetical protein
VDPRIEWQRNQARFVTGELGYLGKYRVFSIWWDGVQGSTFSEGPWVMSCKLPGIKELVGRSQSADNLKARAERVLAHWLMGAGLKLKD